MVGTGDAHHAYSAGAATGRAAGGVGGRARGDGSWRGLGQLGDGCRRDEGRALEGVALHEHDGGRGGGGHGEQHDGGGRGAPAAVANGIARSAARDADPDFAAYLHATRDLVVAQETRIIRPVRLHSLAHR